MTAVLAIGGTDSSCGAGLARDLAVIAAHGLTARICVTAVTAQGAGGVTASQPLPPDLIAAQIAAAGPVAAIKTGMLANAAVIGALIESLPDAPLIIDPVLCATSGAPLLDPDGISALHDLFPRATLLTPNRPEAKALTGKTTPTAQAEALIEQGAKAVLIKGGHDTGDDATDILFTSPPRAFITHRPFTTARLPGTRRGTGCTLASAIACNLALGQSLEQAVASAKAYLTDWWRG